jgi:glycosidase
MVVQLKLPLIALLLVGCVAPSDTDSNWTTTAGQTGDWRDEVIYQVMIDRFANGDINNDFRVLPGDLGRYQGGDYQGLIDHLDYLQKLGVTALWISPVVRNLETDANFDGYHGYWTRDFSSTNPHFGTMEKLRELTRAAHARNMKVILDIVTNHVGQLFYYDINGNGSPDDNVYGAGCGAQPPMNTQPCPQPAVITHISEYDPDYDPNGVRGYTSLGFSGPAPIHWLYDAEIDRGPTLPGGGAGEALANQRGFSREDWYHRKGRITDYGQRDQVLTGDFPGGLKDLKTELPDVQAALTAVFARWIHDGDFDGFRIDTLKHIDHDFWQAFCPGIRQYAAGQTDLVDPLADLHNASPTVPALTVPKQNFFMFGESFDGDDVLNGSYTFNQEVDSTFYFSQKFTVFDAVWKQGGPTTLIEQQFQRKEMDYSAQPNMGGIGIAPRDALVNFLDNHDVPRFLFDKPDINAFHGALGYLFTEDGIPCIYYGTEQGFSGGNDPYNRERLWDAGFATDGDTFAWIQKLIAVRKAYQPLRRGALTIRWSTTRVANEQDAGIFAFDRADSGHTVLVVVNTNPSKTSETSATTVGGAAMTTAFAAGTQLVDVLDTSGASVFVVGPGGTLTVQVPAWGTRILVPQPDVVPITLP